MGWYSEYLKVGKIAASGIVDGWVPIVEIDRELDEGIIEIIEC